MARPKAATPDIEPIAPREAPSTEVARRLLDYLLSGKVRTGERIPLERQLALQLGVGRSAVRDALRPLLLLGSSRRVRVTGRISANPSRACSPRPWSGASCSASTRRTTSSRPGRTSRSPSRNWLPRVGATPTSSGCRGSSARWGSPACRTWSSMKPTWPSIWRSGRHRAIPSCSARSSASGPSSRSGSRASPLPQRRPSSRTSSTSRSSRAIWASDPAAAATSMRAHIEKSARARLMETLADHRASGVVLGAGAPRNGTTDRP